MKYQKTITVEAEQFEVTAEEKKAIDNREPVMKMGSLMKKSEDGYQVQVIMGSVPVLITEGDYIVEGTTVISKAAFEDAYKAVEDKPAKKKKDE